VSYSDGVRAPEIVVSGEAGPEALATGRLEPDVQRVCNEWLSTPGWQLVACTAKFISVRIAAGGADGSPAPSVSSVAAVLKRWHDIGAAKISTRPPSFVEWTEAGVNSPLPVLYEKARRSKKLAQAASKRVVPTTKRGGGGAG
jgi:hypothetical protein